MDCVVVQLLSHVQLFAISLTVARNHSLFFSISQSLLKLISLESVIPSNHLIFCHPLFLLPSIFLSMKVFSYELALCIRWSNYWSFSFRSSPSNEYSRLISFRIHQFALLDVQRTLNSFLQQFSYNLKASTLQSSAFFMVQLSHPYMTTGKNIALIICTFVSKLMSVLFTMLSRFVINFLPESKCLLILQLQSLFAVILMPKKIKYVTVSTFSTSICHELIGPDAMILVFKCSV